MKSRIDEELEAIDLGVLGLSAQVEEALEIITSSSSSRKDRMEDLARDIEDKCKGLELSCTNLLLRFHPVARDLKRISAVLNTVRDLSRIGDNALDFYEMQEYLSTPSLFVEIGLMDMAEEVKKMLFSAVSSFMTRDLEKAKRTEANDDKVDELFRETRRRLVELIKSGREEAEEAIDLVIGAKYLERMADHAANIAHSLIEENGENLPKE